MRNIILKWFERLALPQEWYDEVKLAAVDFVDSEDAVKEPMGCLLKCLYMCESLQDFYKSKGISEDIFYDSLGDIAVWAKNQFEASGKVGINNWGWVCNHVTGNLFKLGRLQFTMNVSNEDIGHLELKSGDPVIEVHIPQGEPLDINACKESIAKAAAFFVKYFPEHRFKWFISHSWLFDYELKNFLGEESNIIKFQRLFDIVKYNESQEALKYLFLNNPQKIIRNSLQKKVMEHINAGGKLHQGYGVIYKDLYLN